MDALDPYVFAMPRREIYDGLERFERAAELELEIKSFENPAPDLQSLLSELTAEMRAQFEAFRAMRRDAEKEMVGSDDAVLKLARADIKAAVDAMSQIVRTLEKIDSLQRTLAHDRARQAEAGFDKAGFDEARGKLLELLEQRACEIANQRFHARLAAEDTSAKADPPDPATGEKNGPLAGALNWRAETFDGPNQYRS